MIDREILAEEVHEYNELVRAKNHAEEKIDRIRSIILEEEQ